MRAIVQRVKHASVEVDGEVVSRIGPGLLALVGVREGDTEDDAEYIARKLLGTRLWQQQGSSGGAAKGKAWSESVVQRGYELLCVSQFTLHARLKGNKPDFCKAMSPQAAREAYAGFLGMLRRQYSPSCIHDGVFGAMMDVALVNDGPVTIILDSRDRLGDGGGGSSASIGGSLASLDLQEGAADPPR